MMVVTWEIIKNFVTSRQLSMQWIDLGDAYELRAFDDIFSLASQMPKTDPATAEQADFETNFKASGNKKLGQSTDDENSPIQRLKMAPAGWTYQLRAIEFESSVLSSLVNETCYGVAIRDCTLKFYGAGGRELTTQETIDTDCVETVIDFEPTYAYEVIGGTINYLGALTVDVRLSVVAVPDVPAAYGGSKIMVCNANLRFVSPDRGVEADGRVSKRLNPDPNYHTNKLRFVINHPAGHKTRICVFLEHYKV